MSTDIPQNHLWRNHGEGRRSSTDGDYVARDYVARDDVARDYVARDTRTLQANQDCEAPTQAGQLEQA